LEGIFDVAVGAFDEEGVLGDAFFLWVEEEFAGVEAGLVVDVDGKLEGGFFVVVEPVVVEEMGVGRGAEDKVAGAGVVDVGGGEFGGFVEDFSDAVESEEGNDGGHFSAWFDVDVGDLVVDHDEGGGFVEVDEEFSVGVFFCVEKAGFAKGEVGEGGFVDIGDAVVAGNDEVAAVGADECGEGSEEGVEVLEVFKDGGVVWAEALEVVIEMGDVDELEVGGVVLPDVFGGFGDPGGAGKAGHGGPVVVEGERAEGVDEGGVEVGRGAVAGGHGFAVGGVGGFGCEDDVCRADGVLPEEEGDFFAGVFPEARGEEEVVGLFPKGDDFAGFGVVGEVEVGEEFGIAESEEAVADDAVFGWVGAGGEGGLGGGGDGGVRRLVGGAVLEGGEGGEVGEFGKEGLVETGDEDEAGARHERLRKRELRIKKQGSRRKNDELRTMKREGDKKRVLGDNVGLRLRTFFGVGND
jgi:hypothetical protein